MINRMRRIRAAKWHRLHYVLALFDVVTVAGGLYLTHRITEVFHDSVGQNQAWVKRLADYAQLGHLASAANAPGNDVFEDHDPVAKRRGWGVRRPRSRRRLPLRGPTRSVLQEFQTPLDEKCHAVAVRVDSVTPAWVDPQLVRQVVANLLSTAIEYTPANGRIDVALRQQNGHVRWSVTDTGLGVPYAAQSRLFEKFYRAENVLSDEAEAPGWGCTWCA